MEHVDRAVAAFRVFAAGAVLAVATGYYTVDAVMQRINDFDLGVRCGLTEEDYKEYSNKLDALMQELYDKIMTN